MQFINIADLVCKDDPQGRTYRQINAEKTHAIPVGTLVETRDGCRFWVVYHGRDCDQTPLYYLCYERDDTEVDREGWRNARWTGGYSEDGLKVVDPQPRPVQDE